MSAALPEHTETDATLARELDEHELDHVCGGGAKIGVQGGADDRADYPAS